MGVKSRIKRAHRLAAWWAVCLCGAGLQVAMADGTAPPNRTIGYVATELRWAIYRTDSGKAECPQGFNDGPREQYAKLYPSGSKRTVVDTQLKLESQTWMPAPGPDPTPFHEASGKISYGLNLDGKIGPHDFTSPAGQPGIDNQLFRVLGCVIGYRGPDGVLYIFDSKPISDDRYNRTLLELTGVDSLVNDDDVEVNVYRGLDRLLTDASGNRIMPGGSQQIDARWGARFMQHYHGRIVDGVLMTEPADWVFPWGTLAIPTVEMMHGMQLHLKISPAGAEGLIGGYADVEVWYNQFIRNNSTHHLSNGQMSAISIYKALKRLADGNPDSKTGANTAISSALEAKFSQVFIQHAKSSTADASVRNLP